MVDPARLTSLKLRRCVVVSAAILPSRLLLIVKLASSQVREVIVSPTKKPPAMGWCFSGGGFKASMLFRITGGGNILIYLYN